MALQGGIQNFGDKYGMDKHRINRLQICCEELIFEMISHCYPNGGPVKIQLDVSYAESNMSANIVLRSDGVAYNPFEKEDCGLGVTILKKMAKSIECHQENDNNRIAIMIKKRQLDLLRRDLFPSDRNGFVPSAYIYLFRCGRGTLSEGHGMRRIAIN